MWYVIQTMTGREQELVDLIENRQKTVGERSVDDKPRNVKGQSIADEWESAKEQSIADEWENAKEPSIADEWGNAKGPSIADEVHERSDGGQKHGRCFVIKREVVWRRQGECIKHTETLFPGYVFVDTESPQELYQNLKKIPKFTKLLGKSELTDLEELEFVSVLEEEKRFLEILLDGDPEDTVRLSPVNTVKNGEITECGGALRHYKDLIVKKRIRLRYVIVRMPFLGQKKDILLGIRLEGDYGEK